MTSVAAADPSAFQCSICMELLHKPCVNACGHSFCFWCMHRAMDAFRTSHACPLCRAPFRHFPAVCAPLHSYLAATFPDEMEEREEETKKMEEEEFGAHSPAVAVRPSEEGGGFDVRAAFECVECRGLAVPPTVLTCGHVACCGQPPSYSSAESEAMPPPRRRKPCPVDGCVGRVAAEGGEGSSVCAVADKILRDHVSESEYREAAAASARRCDGLRPEDVAPPAEETTGAADAGGLTSTTLSFSPNENVILTGLTSTKEKRLNGKIAVVDSFSATTDRYTVKVDHESDDAPREFRVKPKNLLRYVHYAAGCDGCGVFPIAGRRYKCQDCSEEIGFDLCGECYDVGVHQRPVEDGGASAGRFNQQHRPDHSMEEMAPEKSSAFLQWVESDNPDLSIPQIVQMMNGLIDS